MAMAGGVRNTVCNRLYDYLRDVRDKRMTGNANLHSVVHSVASYADTKCSWFSWEQGAIALVLQNISGKFDVTKTTVNAETMVDFLQNFSHSTTVQGFPGIGPQLAKALNRDGIRTAEDLIIKFRDFAMEGGNCKYTCNRFYDYMAGLRRKYPRT